MGGGRRPRVIIVLVPAGVVPGRRERLDDPEAHHLRVRRAADGDAVGLRDGAGLVGCGRLLATGRGYEVEVESVDHRPRLPEATLAVAAGDRERFAWLLEKAVELAITTVVPLETERTRGVASRVREPQLDKLRRQALEAVKQCGAAWATSVAAPLTLSEFLATPRDGHRWLADQAGSPPPPRLDAAAATVIVGPEGGLTDAERAAVLEAGYTAVALGSHVLRFETAAVAAAVSLATARLRGAHG